MVSSVFQNLWTVYLCAGTSHKREKTRNRTFLKIYFEIFKIRFVLIILPIWKSKERHLSMYFSFFRVLNHLENDAFERPKNKKMFQTFGFCLLWEFGRAILGKAIRKAIFHKCLLWVLIYISVNYQQRKNRSVRCIRTSLDYLQTNFQRSTHGVFS